MDFKLHRDGKGMKNPSGLNACNPQGGNLKGEGHRVLMNQSIMVCISLWAKWDRYILCLEKMGECKTGQPTDGGDWHGRPTCFRRTV
ncbi:hypothetical protein FE392_05830 [Xenorhabdus sp. 12]|uniref:Uncharacterized protein n=1 Tax=Xenorhabdus santafensis TaxID=2582833 RepID=A0ABU4S7T7_9GAMM|nr:hypothetical protein [Xenorhabdus sp. 12]MDX7986852.1 hypothetical protein [Xenorhabdus sp. 12]